MSILDDPFTKKVMALEESSREMRQKESDDTFKKLTLHVINYYKRSWQYRWIELPRALYEQAYYENWLDHQLNPRME